MSLESNGFPLGPQTPFLPIPPRSIFVCRGDSLFPEHQCIQKRKTFIVANGSTILNTRSKQTYTFCILENKNACEHCPETKKFATAYKWCLVEFLERKVVGARWATQGLCECILTVCHWIRFYHATGTPCVNVPEISVPRKTLLLVSQKMWVRGFVFPMSGGVGNLRD